LFFAFSLTPSLLPRTALLQGLVSGCSLAAGYAAGVLAHQLWRFLELPVPGQKIARMLRLAAGTACILVAALFLWRASGWQDSIRVLMDMEPVESTRPLAVGSI